MVWALDEIAAWASAGRETALTFEWYPLRAEHTEAIRVWLANSHLAPASANLARTAMRAVLRSCRRRRLMPAGDHEDAVDLPPIPGERLAAGRSLTERGASPVRGVRPGDGGAPSVTTSQGALRPRLVRSRPSSSQSRQTLALAQIDGQEDTFAFEVIAPRPPAHRLWRRSAAWAGRWRPGRGPGCLAGQTAAAECFVAMPQLWQSG